MIYRKIRSHPATSLENFNLPLRTLVDLLILDSIQDACQIYRYKATNHGLSGWMMVGNAAVFSREGIMYFTDIEQNLALKTENIKQAIHDISLTGFYRLNNEQFACIKKACSSQQSFNLEDLNPTRYDKMTSYIEMDPANNTMNQAQKELAELIYFNHVSGKTVSRSKTAHVLPLCRIYLPNPVALKEITKEGAVLYLCSMSLLSNNFYTCMRDLDDKKTYIRGIRKTQKILDDTEKEELNEFFRQILTNPDHYLNKVDSDVMDRLFEAVDRFWNTRTTT